MKITSPNNSRKFLQTANFQSYCIPFILQLRNWIEFLQFIDYLLHGWSRPRLSLHALPHQTTKHTVRYKHHLFVTPLRIWKLSDAHFAKKSTKAVDINLTTIKHNLRTSILLKRNVLYLSVKVFSTKVVIRDNILSYCKTLSIGPTPGIEPATFRWAVKRSTD